MTIYDIKLTNRQAGQHYFSPKTLRFFRSRIGSEVYGDRYFITSEQESENAPRLYTVREAIDGGRSIKTVGGFQAYETRAQAMAAIQNLLKDKPLGASLRVRRSSPVAALSLVALALLVGWGLRR